MSIPSINEVKNLRSLDMKAIRHTGDYEQLYRLARLEKKEGNDELAEQLLIEARKLERDADFAYDRHVDEQLSDKLWKPLPLPSMSMAA